MKPGGRAVSLWSLHMETLRLLVVLREVLTECCEHRTPAPNIGDEPLVEGHESLLLSKSSAF